MEAENSASLSQAGGGSPVPTRMNDMKYIGSFYSNYLFRRMLGFLPNPNFSFLTKVSGLFTNRRRRRKFLPLPLPPPSSVVSSSVIASDARMVFNILEDLMQRILLNLHHIQKNLQFWQSRAEGSNAQKAYFMVCQRGPHAFLSGIIQFMCDFVAEGSGMQHLYFSATSYLSERITILTNLRFFLATFLAQVYMEIDRVGENLVKDPEKSVPSLLITISDLFLNLEASIGHFHAIHLSGSSLDGSYSIPLIFEKLPEINQEGSQWTDYETGDAINKIYQNLHKLESYLSTLVSTNRRPKNVTLHWMHYMCGVVGISVCSAWLLRHSRLMGSSDIDNWIHDAKESTLNFWNDHVEQPVLSIRDELFETFRKRHKGVMEKEEVQLTVDSLHRMLLAFSEQTKGQKFPNNASDQEMLEIVMARYEKELMHPIQNLFGGELARALLIQVQKLKLDIETAMLELDQILRANEINFALLAALPAFFLSLILLMLVRTWFKKDTRAEGRGRAARIQRRLLIVEIERGIVQIQKCRDQGQETDAQCTYGLVLYTLDRLYCAVERHANATGEWKFLRQDLFDLAKPDIKTSHKLIIATRLATLYDCLLPSPGRK